MSVTQPKDARIDFRVRAEQKEVIERAAFLSGLNVSDFIVSTSLAAASEVLERQTKIKLSERDWAQFVEMMEADTEPNEAAKEAAARYNEGRMQNGRYEW